MPPRESTLSLPNTVAKMTRNNTGSSSPKNTAGGLRR